MSIFNKIFSKLGGDVIEKVGAIIDNVHTSSEEKREIKAKLELDIIHAVNTASLKAENEVTERLRIDMNSDSWLSKNVRPMALIFLTISVVSIAFGTIFNATLTAAQQVALETWVPFFTMLMLTVYGFYFSSKGLEKIQRIKKG